MKVFVSWSGSQSHKVALALRDWVRTVLPFVEAYVSSEDIRKGDRWLPEITKELDQAAHGIVCVVPGNSESSWLNFEAGALSRSIERSKVSPFLLDLSPSDLRGPLAQFQCTVYEKSDVKKLVQSLNAAAGSEKLPSVKLDSAFKVCWPGLQKALRPILRDIRRGKAQKPQASVERGGAAPAADPSLDEVQIKILQFLGKQDDQSALTADIPNSLGMTLVQMKYHVKKLEKSRHVWMQYGSVAAAEEVILSDEGREFLVENKLG